jgi:hypothetical protein
MIFCTIITSIFYDKLVEKSKNILFVMPGRDPASRDKKLKPKMAFAFLQ